MAGAVLSDFVLIGAVALGLGALLAASEFWFGVVKWVGVCYLAFTGVMLLRSRGSLDGALQSADTSGATSARSIFLKSFLVAVTNPKGYLFFSAFLPQFIDPAAPQIQQYAVLALVLPASISSSCSDMPCWARRPSDCCGSQGRYGSTAFAAAHFDACRLSGFLPTGERLTC